MKVLIAIFIALLIATPTMAQQRKAITFPNLIPLPTAAATPTTTTTASPTPQQVVAKLQALAKPDAIYAIALAQQANTPGSNVRAQCWQAILNVLPNAPSGIATLGTVTGGSGYDSGGSGVFPGIPLSGGSGTGAIATVTVANGVITEAVLTTPGVHYVVGDILTGAASIGGSGSGFSVPVVGLMATPAEPHLITNVEEIAELIDGLQPTSPLFVNCAGAAQLAQLSVLSFINAIVTGAAGIAVMAPKL